MEAINYNSVSNVNLEPLQTSLAKLYAVTVPAIHTKSIKIQAPVHLALMENTAHYLVLFTPMYVIHALKASS